MYGTSLLFGVVFNDSLVVYNSQCSSQHMPSLIPITRFIFFFKDFIYLTEREQESTSKGSSKVRGRTRFLADQGARCGVRLQYPGIVTWAEGRCLADWATQAPRREGLEGEKPSFCFDPMDMRCHWNNHVEIYSRQMNIWKWLLREYWALQRSRLSSI